MHVNNIIECNYHKVSSKHIITLFLPSYSFILATMYVLNPQFEIKPSPSQFVPFPSFDTRDGTQ
jgi:hypothetical protein